MSKKHKKISDGDGGLGLIWFISAIVLIYVLTQVHN